MISKLIKFTLFGISLLLFSACNGEEKKEFAEVDGISDMDTIGNEYAEAFKIIYHNTFIEIAILNPDTGLLVESYKLSTNDKKDNSKIVKDIQSVVAMSATQVGMLRKLGLEDKIVGFSNFQYLCDPLSTSRVNEVGDISAANAEAFLEVNPDIVLYSGFSDQHPILNKLEKANMQTFKVYEWKETHPLGRAEWIKVYGVLFQKEKEANAIFEKVKTEYFKTADRLKSLEPSESTFAGTYFGDFFNVPAGNSYMAKLFEDANVNYKYADSEGTGSLNLSLEEAITANKNTEYWLNVGVASKQELELQNQKFGHLDAVKNNKVYTYFNNTNCFWENSTINPHLVLKDLGKIFHPELFEDYEFEYYEQLPA